MCLAGQSTSQFHLCHLMSRLHSTYINTLYCHVLVSLFILCQLEGGIYFCKSQIDFVHQRTTLIIDVYISRLDPSQNFTISFENTRLEVIIDKVTFS